jgi:hypothetical protein
METVQVYFKDRRSEIYVADSLAQIFSKIQADKEAYDVLTAEYKTLKAEYDTAYEAATSQEERDALIEPSVAGYDEERDYSIEAISQIPHKITVL